ncbi:hypothetical protein BDV10DRAFT_171468 [Aspergillus recurvatus]
MWDSIRGVVLVALCHRILCKAYKKSVLYSTEDKTSEMCSDPRIEITAVVNSTRNRHGASSLAHVLALVKNLRAHKKATWRLLNQKEADHA